MKLTTDEAILKAIESPAALRKYSADYLRMAKLRTLKGLITLDKKIEILESLGYRATEMLWTEPKTTTNGKKPDAQSLSKLLEQASQKLKLPLSECRRLFSNHTENDWNDFLSEKLKTKN